MNDLSSDAWSVAANYINNPVIDLLTLNHHSNKACECIYKQRKQAIIRLHGRMKMSVDRQIVPLVPKLSEMVDILLSEKDTIRNDIKKWIMLTDDSYIWRYLREECMNRTCERNLIYILEIINIMMQNSVHS